MTEERRREVEYGRRVADLPRDTDRWPAWARERFVEATPVGDRVLVGEYLAAQDALVEEDPAYRDRSSCVSPRPGGEVGGGGRV